MRTVLLAFFLLVSLGLTAQDLETVLKKHYRAIGGKKLEQKESWLIKGKRIMGKLEFDHKEMFHVKKGFRMETVYAEKVVVTTYNGKEARQSSPYENGPISTLTGKQKRSIKEMASPGGILLNYEDWNYTASYQGMDSTSTGIYCHVIEVIRPDDSRVKFFIDEKSWLTEMKVEIESPSMGDLPRMVTYYSDYQKVDGVTMPFQTLSYLGDRIISGLKISSVEFDLALRKDLLKNE